jgi:hypothetical protein
MIQPCNPAILIPCNPAAMIHLRPGGSGYVKPCHIESLNPCYTAKGFINSLFWALGSAGLSCFFGPGLFGDQATWEKGSRADQQDAFVGRFGPVVESGDF